MLSNQGYAGVVTKEESIPCGKLSTRRIVEDNPTPKQRKTVLVTYLEPLRPGWSRWRWPLPI